MQPSVTELLKVRQLGIVTPHKGDPKMNKRSSFLLFSLFLLSFALPSAVATTPSGNVELFASNLQFNLNTGSAEHIIVGHEKSLYDMREYGVDYVGDGYYEYHSKLYFDVEANVYSTLSSDDVFTARELDLTATWLDLHTCTDFNVHWTTRYFTRYNIEYSSYDLQEFHGYGIDYPVEINCEFNDLSPSILELDSSTFETDTKEFTANIAEIRVVDSTISRIGEYDVYYQGDNTASLSVTDLNPDVEPDGDNGVAQQIDQFNLGAERGDRTTPTYQQGEVMIQSGVVTDNRFMMTLKPDVKIHRETIIVTYQNLYVDTATAALGISPAGVVTSLTQPSTENTYDRIIGWEVTNYNINIHFSVEVDLTSLTRIQYIDSSDGNLADVPSYLLEDVYFSNLFSGDTGAGLVLDSSDPLASFMDGIWEQYKWYIIVGVGIVALVYLGPMIAPMIMPMMNMASNTAGNVQKMRSYKKDYDNFKGG